MFFWILFAVDAVAACVALFFFLWGISDGTVSETNSGEWLMLLAGIGAVLGGGWLLRRVGRNRQAYGLLAVLAIPCVGGAVLLLAAMILQPRWN